MNPVLLRGVSLVLVCLALVLLVVPFVGNCDWPLGEVLGGDDVCREAVSNYAASGLLLLGGAAVTFGLYLSERARR